MLFWSSPVMLRLSSYQKASLMDQVMKYTILLIRLRKNFVYYVNTSSVKPAFLCNTMKKCARNISSVCNKRSLLEQLFDFQAVRHRSQLFEVISVTSQKLNVDLKIPCLPHIFKNVIFSVTVSRFWQSLSSSYLSDAIFTIIKK